MFYTVALALAHYTRELFPAFSTVIGWLSVSLTGSVTSSAVLFGKLQQVTAIQLGMNPVLTTSANIAGRETDLVRRTWKYSLLLGVVALLVGLQACITPGVVPQDMPGLSP
jgi:lactate permease